MYTLLLKSAKKSLLAICVTSMGLTTVQASVSSSEQYQAVQGQNIQIEPVKSAVYDRMVSIGGTVIPFKKVTISAQVGGEVNFVAGIEGDAFHAGELLISTDDKALLAKRAAAMAEWRRAMASYQNAVAQYNRELWSPRSEQPMPGMALPNMMDQMFTRPFSDKMGIGDKDAENRANLIAVQAQLEQAVADMERVKAQIAEIDIQLSHTKLVAPFNGVIVKKQVEAGDAVQPGMPLLVFAKSRHLTVEVNIPVNLMQGIKKGEVFHAKLANKVPVLVRVAQVFPVADDLQHTVKVKFDLPVGAPAAPGMYAEVEIKNAASQNLQFPIVPKTAIIQRGSLPTIYVYDPKSHVVTMRIVRIGKSAKNGFYIVLSGLKEGESILVNPPVTVVSGMKVVSGKLMAKSVESTDTL